MNLKKIYIQKELQNNKKILKFLNQTKNLNLEIKYFSENLKDFITKLNIKNINNQNKKNSIIFANQNGTFIKKCPCTPNYLACNYYVVELSVGCLYNCSYCYLQEYQNVSATTFYLNFEKLFLEFDKLLTENPQKLYRIGFGEYADSLFLDEYLNYTNEISGYLAKQSYKNYLIEFKTKSNNIKNILNFNPTGHEIIGWSINTIPISNNEEKLTSNFYERLEAMKNVAENNFFIAIHFDPIIIYKNSEKDYKFVIDEIYKNIDKNKIIYISIGSLRFNQKLKPIIEYNHKNTKIIYGEFIRGIDNKVRYLKQNRIKIYEKIINFLKEKDKNFLIYFCMEDHEVWKKTLNLEINNNNNIHKLFCDRLNFLSKNKLNFN